MSRISSPLTRIALVMHEDSSYIRQIMEGVVAYARPSKPWLFHRVLPERLEVAYLKSWKPDAILSHAVTDQQVRVLNQFKIPIVSVASIFPRDPYMQATCDDHAIGELAARHLIDQGFTTFGFVGIAQLAYSDFRFAGYQRFLKFHRCWVSSLLVPREVIMEQPDALGSVMDKPLYEWLEALPKPVAIFACNDAMALWVAEACRILGINVPEKVAILGADNDELICQMAFPPLSSVQLPLRRLGYEAAGLLDQMISQSNSRPQFTKLHPIGIQTRQSSDILAITDIDVAMAVRFIREHALESMNVSDILAQVPITRRSLERRFRTILGRSPLQEIQRVRLEHARQLLAGTDLPMPEIAQRSGFGSYKHFSQLFLGFQGQTPSSYRSAHQLNMLNSAVEQN